MAFTIPPLDIPTALGSIVDTIPSTISSYYDTALTPILLGDGTPVLSFTGHHQNAMSVDGDFRGVYAIRFSRDGLVVRDLIRLNFLSHETLDRLYVMIFPDGGLVVPSGPDFLTYGSFLAVEDLDAVLATSQFDSAKHLRHSRGWKKVEQDAGQMV